MNFQYAKGLLTGRLEALAKAAPDNLKDLVAKVHEAFDSLCSQVEDSAEETPATVDEPEAGRKREPRKKRGRYKKRLAPATPPSGFSPRKIDLPDLSGCKRLQEVLSIAMPLCGGSVKGMSEMSGVAIETLQRLIRGDKGPLRSDAKARLQAAFGIPDKFFISPPQEKQ